MTRHRLPRGIRMRGRRYQVDVTYKGVRRTATCATLEEAEAKRVELLHGLVNGTLAAPSNARTWTLKEAVERTFEVAWNGTKSERTMRINAEQLKAHFGENLPLDHIDANAIDKFVAACQKKGNSDGTINRKLACLSKVFSVAYARGGVKSKPRIDRRKEANGRIRFLTEEEEEKFLTLFRQWGRDEEADAVAVLVDTGLRVGELLRLEDRDVNFEVGRNGIVYVWEAKANTPGSVPLTKRAASILSRRIQAVKRLDDKRLFPVPYARLHDAWERAKAVLGLHKDDQLVLHALRHTFASRLVQKGVPIPVVKELMRHKTIAMTMRYAHLAPANLLNAIAVLDHDGGALEKVDRSLSVE